MIQKKKKFLCLWDTRYYIICKGHKPYEIKVGEDSFTLDNGYDFEQRKEIIELRVGEIFSYLGHFVQRIK